MADQSDVETALAGLVGGALYPGGIGAPCAAAGAVCRIYRGWPVSAALDADLLAGRSNVSVAAIAQYALNTTRWPDIFSAPVITVPTLRVTVDGTDATVSGGMALGQVVALVADRAWAGWRTQPGDTPASIAASLAQAMRRVRPASAQGPTVSVPGAVSLSARVEADQPLLRQTRRQLQAFRVTCWCPDPMTRDAVGSAIDGALSGIGFIGLADGTSGRLRYLTSVVSDRWEDAALFRRELTYSVEYPTTIALDLPRMAVGAMAVAPDGQGVIETLLS